MAYPQPRDTSKRHFQAAAPVDADRIRVCPLPGVPLLLQFGSVLFLSGQSPGLRQDHQMLMPVQFPRDLVITDLGEIEKIDLEPWFEWRPFAMDYIQMPINFGAVVEVRVSQQAEAVTTDFVRLTEDAFHLRAQVS